jgi:hypothetical protein
MNKRVKVNFKLDQDEDDYPPFAWEGLWAESIGEGIYKIDNIPFYVQGISAGDVVHAEDSADGLTFDRVISKSENSTIRVILYSEDVRASLFDIIKECKCEYEVGVPKTLIAINVPSDGALPLLLNFLNREHTADRLDYEESALRYQHIEDRS